jgi:hypothetical protein
MLNTASGGIGRMGKRYPLHFLNGTPQAELLAVSTAESRVCLTHSSILHPATASVTLARATSLVTGNPLVFRHEYPATLARPYQNILLTPRILGCGRIFPWSLFSAHEDALPDKADNMWSESGLLHDAVPTTQNSRNLPRNNNLNWQSPISHRFLFSLFLGYNI